jgi:hypothetical protein
MPISRFTDDAFLATKMERENTVATGARGKRVKFQAIHGPKDLEYPEKSTATDAARNASDQIRAVQEG